MRPPGGGHVAAHGVGAQVEHVAVAAGAQHDGVGRVALDLTGDEITGDDAAGLTVLHHELEHLRTRVHVDLALADHAHHLLVGAQQQLLAGLAACVEGAGHLGAAEGAVGQQAAVLTGERHALCGHLVDDVGRHLGQAIRVRFAAAVVAALDRVVEQAVRAVAVVLVVLRGVDAALCGDRVGPTGRVVEGERVDVVAELGQRGRCRGSGEPGADHDDLELPLVGRVDQLDVELVLVPFLGERAIGNVAVERAVRVDGGGFGGGCHGGSPQTRSARTARGKLMLPTRISRAKPAAK